jgi:glycosyltransferase involved in cell wall biosynthesis
MIMYGKHVGGAEMQFIELANFLVQRHPVELISLGGDGSLKAASIDPRIEVRVYKHTVKRLLFVIPKRFAIYPALFKVLLRGVRGQHQTIISTSYWGDVPAYLISKLVKVKLLSLQTVSTCIHNPRVDRFVLQHFDYLVAGAGDIREYLLGHGQDDARIRVIHNWVDFSARTITQSAAQVKAQYGFADKPVIGCIGRLHPQKGQIVLIRAFAQAKGQLLEHVLVLVGDGPERTVLTDEADRLGLANRIFFLGGLSGDAYNNVLAAMDIYVQPSIFEGLPRTVLDAMYIGKPIIASDANGNREAIRHGVNGYLVPPQDADALAQAIVLLANDVALRTSFAEQAMQDARRYFDMQQQLKKIEALALDEKT